MYPFSINKHGNSALKKAGIPLSILDDGDYFILILGAFIADYCIE